MFDWFSRKYRTPKYPTWSDIPEPPKVVPFPDLKAVPSVEPPVPEAKEHYRVGFNDQGMTTLTLLGEYGSSMTLSMNQEACEHLIRMLRSSYQNDVDPTPTDDPDGGLPLPIEDKKVA